MPPKKKPSIEYLTDKDAGALSRHVDQRVRDFKGDIGELESAIGMLTVGRLMGWKPLTIIHNKRTIRKYEEILGISIREEFEEEGCLVRKSVGYSAAKRIGEFWKVVSGSVRVDGRKLLE